MLLMSTYGTIHIYIYRYKNNSANIENRRECVNKFYKYSEVILNSFCIVTKLMTTIAP